MSQGQTFVYVPRRGLCSLCFPGRSWCPPIHTSGMQTAAFLTLHEALVRSPLLLWDKYIPQIQVAAGIKILKSSKLHIVF